LPSRARSLVVLLVAGAIASAAVPARAADCTHPTRQPEPVVPTDTQLCRALDPIVRDPSGLPLAEYQEKLKSYLDGFCHRDKSVGWVRDKSVRDTGPFTAQWTSGTWQQAYHGTHAPVVVWYSPEMHDWMKANRSLADEEAASDRTGVPDGAIMVKEMYPAPASVCRDVEPEFLMPVTSGAAIMIRDAGASQDGWFWGWFGWQDWQPDYPAPPSNPMPDMGFAQYCLNCHSSARSNRTFAALRNVEGEPGRPLVFLSQDTEPAPAAGTHHQSLAASAGVAAHPVSRRDGYDTAFIEAFALKNGAAPPTDAAALKLPSETYDHTFVAADGPTIHDQFLTSSQCLGCHDAGSTGLQFDMTVPVDPAGANAPPGRLWNHSPYATWRTSPMGLSGRDPVFFAQLASETQTFHEQIAPVIEDKCLGCHGFLGQRQYGIDQAAKTSGEGGAAGCGTFTRAMVDAAPWPESKSENPLIDHANYGALARDGVSCLSCHRMVLGEEASAAVRDQEQNACAIARQEFLNPGLEGFARTFTGSFLVGDPGTIYGPYEDPKTAPMKDALGMVPAHNSTLAMSETCGTCHTVHLPVFHRGEQVGQVYEQLTYPEWAFSAYRTGVSPDGPLPEGAGARAKSCQDCHMPSTDPNGTPTRSRIASIQEYSRFPQADSARPPEEIDVPVRDGFSRHTLVGLNIFLTKMAQQFPDVLGIRTQDPMLGEKGVAPLIYTERKILEQAANATVDVTIPAMRIDRREGVLEATVTLTNHVGHKFPSGVGFRRAFLTFDVIDRGGNVIWTSGATDAVGRIVDGDGDALPGETWWTPDCASRIEPDRRHHQPHHQTITRQDQVQIYQELVSAPADVDNPQCGHDASPQGALTTSFLSICAEVKDNRLLPTGFLPLERRIAIARALGAEPDMAEDAGSTAVDKDPDYADGSGGGDSLTYAVPLSDMKGEPDRVRARLWYQATPPFYLQDRFCTARGADPERLYYLAGHLNLAGSPADGWKLLIDDTGPVSVGP